MATHDHSEVKEFVVRSRLRLGSKKMSRDGECLQVRMRETQVQRLLAEYSRAHEEMAKSTCPYVMQLWNELQNWTVFFQKRQQEPPLTDRPFTQMMKMAQDVQLMDT